MDDQQERKIQLLSLVKELNSIEERFGKNWNEVNIFLAAGFKEQEARHSSILAFLLNPLGWHGIGDFLLRRIIMKASEEKENALDFAFCDLKDVKVRTELITDRTSGRLDILVFSESSKVVLIIENKVRAKQGNEQLKKYSAWARKKYPNEEYKVLFLYLTLNEDEPDEKGWVAMPYSYIIEQLRDVVEIKSEAIPVLARTYINQYIDLVTRHIMNNEDAEFTERVAELWKNYGSLLDKIQENKPDSNFAVAAKEFMKKDGIITIVSRGGQFHFLPKQLSEMPKTRLMQNAWSLKKDSIGYPLHFCLDYKNEQARLTIYVGPYEGRQDLIDAIRNTGLKPNGRARFYADKFTRIWNSDSLDISNESTPDEYLQILKELMTEVEKSEVINKIAKALEALRESNVTGTADG